jgi:hypothetical protein
VVRYGGLEMQCRIENKYEILAAAIHNKFPGFRDYVIFQSHQLHIEQGSFFEDRLTGLA